MHRVFWTAFGIAYLGLVPQLPAAAPALDGNCVVCLYDSGKLVPGKKDYQATIDRTTYYFPGAEQLAAFRANPAKYIPALGGDCIVCKVEKGTRVAGKAEFSLKYSGRLYLFPSASEQGVFRAYPAKYAMADVALGGNCPVCLIDAKKRVAGKQAYISIYDGLFYFFPGAGQKATFDANPAKYVPALGGDCVVCLKDYGKHVAGTLSNIAHHDGRYFLFPDKSIKQKFKADPAAYARVDWAENGNCVVCKKKSGKEVAGTLEHTSVYKGKLYLFPGEEQKEAFNADPALYVATSAALSASAQERK